MPAGKFSIKLSHNISACNCCKRPTLSGTSVNKLPPTLSTCKLLKTNREKFTLFIHVECECECRLPIQFPNVL